jgi:hypothetical protein
LYCKPQVEYRLKAQAKGFGLSVNQMLKALVLAQLGLLPRGFWDIANGSEWDSQRRALYLRGK